MSKTITVRGTGKISAKPDLISLSLTVEAKNVDYAAAMEQAASDAETVVAAVRDAGLPGDALKTAHFNVRTEYESVHDDRGNWKNVFAGYAVSHGLALSFPLDLEILSALLGSLGSSGANPQLGISFTLADPEKARREALEAAVRDAREKASVLASASGAALGELTSVQYNVSSRELVSPTAFEADGAAMPRMAKASVRLNAAPQDIDVTDDAVFVWEIR